MPIYKTPRTGVSLSQVIAEAYASAPTNDVLLHTIELVHPAFLQDGQPTAVRAVRDYQPLVARLESSAPLNAGTYVTFAPIPFEFTLPEESDEGGAPSMRVAVDNVSRELAQHLNAAKGSRAPVDMRYRPYMTSDLSGPHILPVLCMQLHGIVVGLTRVTATARFGGTTNRRFPAMVYTRSKFIGLGAR